MTIHPSASMLLGLLAVAAVACGGPMPDGSQPRQQAVIAQQGTLAISVSTAGPAQVGQQQTFTTVVTNPTASDIANVFGGVGVYTFNGTASSARSTQGSCPRNGPSQFICFFGTVAAGASVTVTTVVVPSDAGVLTFESGAGTANDGTSDFTDITVAPSPTDAQITGSASNGSPPVGSDFSYTFQVKNDGPYTADAVTFADTLPAALPVRSVSATSGVTCQVSGQTVSCAIGTMPVGSQAGVVVGTTAPLTPQTITDTASVASTTPDKSLANNSVSVTVQIK